MRQSFSAEISALIIYLKQKLCQIKSSFACFDGFRATIPSKSGEEKKLKKTKKFLLFVLNLFVFLVALDEKETNHLILASKSKAKKLGGIWGGGG